MTIEEMFDKLLKGIETKYINDLKMMEDFNASKDSESKDKVIEQFFDEMTRMLLELKMRMQDPLVFRLEAMRLNYFFLKAFKILQIDYNDAMEQLRGLTK